MSGIRYDGNLTTAAQIVPVGASAPVFTMPYSVITIYESGTPPLTLASLFSDEALTMPIANPITADSQGHFGFWITPGVYLYTANTANGVLIGTYNLTLTSPQGPMGTPATVAIGTVQTTPPGGAASVSNSGTESSAILNFQLPQGQTGPTGAIGATGATGLAGANGIASLSTLASVRTTSPLGSVNLLDPTQALVGYYINAGTGTPVADSALTSSGFIPANSGGTMITTASIVNSAVAGIVFYDQNQTFLGGDSIVNVTSGTFSVPAAAAFVRVTYTTASLSSIMMMNGGTLPESYQAFTYYPSNVVDANIAASIVTADAAAGLNLVGYTSPTISALENLFIPANATTGEALHVSGSIVGGLGSNFFITDYMPIVPSKTLIASQQTVNNADPTYGWLFYDINKNFLSYVVGTAANTPVAIPAAPAAYVRASFDTGTTSGLQINIGSVLMPSFAGQVTTVTNAARAYSGQKWMPFGDSISAIFNPGYANAVVANMGLTVPYQDARGGRTTQFIFENYSNNPATGVGLGGNFGINGGSSSPQTSLPYGWPAAGNTLAQDLAQIEVVTVYLGTNDASLAANMGALGDAIGSGTYYGYLRYAIEGFLVAKPGLQLMWVGPYMNVDSGASTAAIVTAQQAICASYGVPYLNLFQNSGMNTFTYSAFTGGDDIHPNTAGLAMLARLITGFISNR